MFFFQLSHSISNENKNETNVKIQSPIRCNFEVNITSQTDESFEKKYKGELSFYLEEGENIFLFKIDFGF